MEKLKKPFHILYMAILVLLIGYSIGMSVAPEQVSEWTGYRFYTVLTDSMEPRIPTYSLVCSRNLKEDEILEPQQIITFRGDRFGKSIILTHHFNKIETDINGKTIYRTNAEGKTELDMYHIERKDIVGTYVFHIPYIGKILLFLKSSYGVVMIGELCIIYLVNRLIKSRWAEKVKVDTDEQEHYTWRHVHGKRDKVNVHFHFTDMQQEMEQDALLLSGNLVCELPYPVRFVEVELTLYNKDRGQISSTKLFVCGKEAIQPHEKKAFSHTEMDGQNVAYYHVRVVKYRR